MQFPIDRFEGNYIFLSNFYDDGIHPPVEILYQASKAIDTKDFEVVMQSPTANVAKKRGRNIDHIRPDWEKIKVNVMLGLLIYKFSFPELQRKLIDTGECELIEGNTWHDNFWGNCICDNCVYKPGKNMLGILLMKVRNLAQTNMLDMNG